MYFEWKPYVPVAQRRRLAEIEMRKLARKGQPVSPVAIEGRTIASTFWGKAWCENLEGYSDFANRLPRGRTYVRNGSVVDLQIRPGEVAAKVSGSELYDVRIQVSAVPKPRWGAICNDCAGAVDSLVELLQGRFSTGVMERICRQRTGLFPAPKEIELSCSCPDWASMCKHVAAVLYGVGARLDQRPELLFKLRKVDEKDLIAQAGRGLPLSKARPSAKKILVGDGLAELFGLEMGDAEATSGRAAKPARSQRAQETASPTHERALRPRRTASPLASETSSTAVPKARFKRGRGRAAR